MKGFFLNLLVIFLVSRNVESRINPLKDPNICGRPTCNEPLFPKFNYNPEVRQTYRYAANVVTLFEGASSNVSRLHVQATVSLDWVTRCEGVLRLVDVHLKETEDYYDRVEDIDYESPAHDRSPEFAHALEQFPLRFSWEDGIVSELCPDEEEPTWVLNIKRGLLSLFHNTMERLDVDYVTVETDVHGVCPTEYRLQGAHGTSLVMEKSKLFEKCHNRHKLQSVIQTTPYSFRTNYKELPLVKSELQCTISIDHNIHNLVECRERHLFQPFSGGDGKNGAVTTVHQRLSLLEEESGTNDEGPNIEKRFGIIYDHRSTPKPAIAELKAARGLIKQLCDITGEDRLLMDFPEVFRQYIHSARQISYTALYHLYLKTGTVCLTGRKHFLDALPFLGSSAAVELMKKLIIEDKISQQTADEWLLSIALIPRPDEMMLKSLLELWEHYPKDTTVALAISSVAHSFCKNTDDCQGNSYLMDIVDSFESKVTSIYEQKEESMDRASKEMMLRSLKALGNIGVMTDSADSLLMEIALDKKIDVEIRVSAIQTYRRFPCEQTSVQMLNLLGNQAINSEVRIASYLQVMRCPNYRAIEILRSCLEKEEVNQVGSFIWSHLQNLMKSSMPTKLEVQALLYDKDLTKKFSSDVRKFSTSYESSFFSNEYNAGASYESNVIYATDSFIPRSLSFNVSVELFSEVINFFEISTRLENFEHYLESFFGPKGPFTALKEQLAKNVRWPRDTKSQNDILKTAIDNLPNMVEGKFEEPKLSLGLKVFGNELKHFWLSGDQEIRDGLKKLSPLEYLKTLLSGKEINYNRASMFLDSSYIIPTGTGFPLVLNAVGTSAFNVKLRGSVKGANFLEDKELDIFGSFQPSVTLNVVGTMSVDAYYASTGIKLKTYVSTSTAVEGDLKIRGMNLVSLKFKLPQQETKIFSASSELMVMKDNDEEPQSGIETRTEDIVCSWPTAYEIIGLKICNHYQFPNMTSEFSPNVVLSGPASYSLSIPKADTTAKTYQMEYAWFLRDNMSEMVVFFDTPDSQMRKHLLANLTIDTVNQNWTLYMRANGAKYTSKGRYKMEDLEKYLYMDLESGGKKQFDFGMSLSRKNIKYGWILNPRLYVAVHNERLVDLNGSVKYVLKVLQMLWEIDMNFRTKNFTSNLVGTVTRSPVSFTSKLIYKYQVSSEFPQESIVLEVKSNERIVNHMRTYLADYRLESSEFPKINLDVGAKVQVANGHIDCKLDLNYGPHWLDKNHTLTIQYVFLSSAKPNGRKLTKYLEIRRPSTKLYWRFQTIYEQSGPSMRVATAISYAPDKTISAELHLYTPRSTLFFLEAKFNLTHPEFYPALLEVKVHEKMSREYDLELKGQWFNGYNLSTIGRYQDKSTAIASNHYFKLLLQSNRFDDVNLVAVFYVDKIDFKMEVKAQQNNDMYSVLGQYNINGTHSLTSLGELRLKEKVYSASCILTEQIDGSQMLLEFHIDKWRDIVMRVRGLNRNMKKQLDFELKWNANRDPDERLVIGLDFRTPSPHIYRGNFNLSYPGRNLNTIFDYDMEALHYMTFAKLHWNFTEFIQINVTSDSKLGEETKLTMDTEILSSVDHWERIILHTGFKHVGNMYQSAAKIAWQDDQSISLELFGDHSLHGLEFLGVFNGSLVSTVRHIPSLQTAVEHYQNLTRADSRLSIIYDLKKKFEVVSTWDKLMDSKSRYLSGKVSIANPFSGYSNILYTTKYYSKDNYVRGLVSLSLDLKQYMASMKGHWKKVTDNMFVLNITTPMDDHKYSLRLGLSEQDRHLVAEIKTPITSTGVELLCAVQNISDFNVKFNLDSPFRFMENVLLVGKYQGDRADFRAGWNYHQVGFSGVWNFNSFIDFEHSYTLYTPITGYEETAVICKLILNNGVDIEFSTKLANTKVGAVIQLKPKPNLRKELGFDSDHEFMSTSEKENTATLESANENIEDILHVYIPQDLFWVGHAQFDTYFYPSIKANLDLEKIGQKYGMLLSLQLPSGVIDIMDEFTLEKGGTNNLKITTPYASCKEITSKLVLEVENRQNVMLDLKILRNAEWIEMGLAYKLLKLNNSDNSWKLYNISISLETPLKILSHLNMEASVEMEGDAVRASYKLDAVNTSMFAFVTGKGTENQMDTTVHCQITTPIFRLPMTKINLKKNCSDIDDNFDFSLEVSSGRHKPKYTVRTWWMVRSRRDFEVSLKTELPIQPLEYVDWRLKVNAINEPKTVQLKFVVLTNSLLGNATLHNNNLDVEVLAELLNEQYPVTFTGTLTEPIDNKQQLSGVMNFANISHNVSGDIDLYEEWPRAVALNFEPDAKDVESIAFRYDIQAQKNGYDLKSTYKKGESVATMDGNLIINHKYDWNLHTKLDLPIVDYKTYVIDAKMLTPNINNMTLEYQSISPFRGLELTKFGYTYLAKGPHGAIGAYHLLANSKGTLQVNWKLVLLKDMMLKIIGDHQMDEFHKDVAMHFFYVDKEQSFQNVELGGDFNVDKDKWVLGSNVTWVWKSDDMEVHGNLNLPEPKQVHSVKCKYFREILSSSEEKLDYFAKYYKENTSKSYGISGEVTYFNKTNTDGTLNLNWGPNKEQSIRNTFSLKKHKNDIDLIVGVATPKYANEDTFKVKFLFVGGNPYQNITLQIRCPESKEIIDTRFDFSNFENLRGRVNMTTPSKKYPWLGTEFNIETLANYSQKRFQLLWTNNSALIDSKLNRKMHYGNLEVANGEILVEIPVKTRHIAKFDYEYTEKPLNTKGSGKLHYNNTKILEGKYNCDSESKAGIDKDVVDIEVESKITSFGIKYIHSFEYSAPGDGSNLPTKDSKHVQLYQLNNATGFRITGEMDHRSNDSGNMIVLRALQADRKVVWSFDYDVQDQLFKQRSNLMLSPNLYLDLDFKILNKTEDDSFESQELEFNILTPLRNVTMMASYNATSSSLLSEVELLWNSEKKSEQKHSLQSSLSWQQKSSLPNVQEIEIKLMHPSFEKDATLRGYIEIEDRSQEFGVEAEYCNDPERKFILMTTFNDTSKPLALNYMFSTIGTHSDTNFDLSLIGTLNADLRELAVIGKQDARYKRSFFPTEYSEVDATLDLWKKMVEYKKETRTKSSYFSAMCDGFYPVYTANMTRRYGEDINEAGDFYLHLHDKVLNMEYNMTEDGSQSFHINGKIPDARSASLYIWRDYEDIKVTDMSYFLSLNHSRLVVSSFRWRPELRDEIKSNIHGSVKESYQDLIESINYWRKYIRFEIIEEMGDVWENSKSYIQGFLDDVKALNVLKEDVNRYEDFFNASYYNNDFYVYDIVNFTTNTLKTMSEKTRHETLPKIVNEILDLMGDSGRNIWSNFEQFWEKIKNSYDHCRSFLLGLIESDPMQLLRSSLDRIFINCDQMVDEAFLTTVKYLDKLWDQVYVSVITAREGLLEAAAPVILETARYMHNLVFYTVSDFIDYMSARASEIINTPYFHWISKYLSYLDQIYKDFTTNDTPTLIYKYFKYALQYLNRKLLPDFQPEKEWAALKEEVFGMIRDLRKNRIIATCFDKLEEVYGKVQWFYEFINGPKGIIQFFKDLYTKWVDINLTALQAENKYRIPKTKFVYDTKIGLIHLEQKLPMSWHAFNETPRFEEIPEVKALGDLQNYFTKSNTTLWTIYSDYKPYMETKDWLPPFNVRALLIGSHNYMTFDRKYYDFRGSCSYLLASDFLDGNFSMAVSYPPNKQGKTHTLHLFLRNGTVINVDVFAKTVSVGNNNKVRLPLTVEDTFIYKEADILTVESKLGYTLQCNMEFGVCVLDLSGWYFGKTAGLFGTINNEPSDDFLTSSNEVTPTVQDFAKSWTLPASCEPTPISLEEHKPSRLVESLCEQLFRSKMSPFHACFHRIDPEPFKQMCLGSQGEKDVCTVAVGYMEACRAENTPLRIPDTCVKCKLLDGKEVSEGTFVHLNSSEIPRSTDIVFIVEAKECNRDIKNNRSIDALVSLLHKELNSSGINDNRYTVVVFGGSGVYEEPRSIIVDNEVFGCHQTIPFYFENIPVGNGSSDIFEAINFATNLVFRPGVSKTFILLPCSDCNHSKMKRLDYAAVYQLLREYDITLHILMNDEFQFTKGSARINKAFFGIDHENAYTKKDAKTLTGDPDLRRQARVAKTTLGHCVPLALETNGTVFSGKKLEAAVKRATVKTFLAVWSKRVAVTAVPSDCQTCECNAHDHGQSYMECFPCQYPATAISEQDFDDDSLLTEEEMSLSEEQDVDGSEEM